MPKSHHDPLMDYLMDHLRAPRSILTSSRDSLSNPGFNILHSSVESGSQELLKKFLSIRELLNGILFTFDSIQFNPFHYFKARIFDMMMIWQHLFLLKSVWLSVGRYFFLNEHHIEWDAVDESWHETPFFPFSFISIRPLGKHIDDTRHGGQDS